MEGKSCLVQHYPPPKTFEELKGKEKGKVLTGNTKHNKIDWITKRRLIGKSQTQDTKQKRTKCGNENEGGEVEGGEEGGEELSKGKVPSRSDSVEGTEEAEGQLGKREGLRGREDEGTKEGTRSSEYPPPAGEGLHRLPLESKKEGWMGRRRRCGSQRRQGSSWLAPPEERR